MADNARKLINSPLGLKIATTLGKYTPDWIGRKIAISIANFISAHKRWRMVRAIRCNQWVVSGQEMDQQILDSLVAKNLQNIALSIYEYYHKMNDPAAALRVIEPNPFALQLVQRPEFAERGLILAGIHMSNFDVIFQAGGLAGVKALTITLAEFDAAYQKQWEMRLKNSIKVINASIGSIKYAIDYLRQGGMVVTAIDRPEPESRYQLKFFGHPANMPIHHVFMALKANVPIVVAAVIKKQDGKYHILFSDPIEMVPHPDRHTEIVTNAENILRVVEDFICNDPSQWSMTFPVWPELLPQC